MASACGPPSFASRDTKLFSLDRSEASLSYTVTMLGIVFGNVFMGRMVDKFGVVTPTLISALCLGIGYFGIAFVESFGYF